jgi:hypothetical protein
MTKLYHVEVNSIYVEIVKVRYSCEEYFKAWLRYYTKASDMLIAEEKSAKINKSIFKYWKEGHGKKA